MTIKIFLGNLSSDTSSDAIRPLFEKYGEVAECDVLKNFGFVHMTNKGDANKAIAQLDGYSVDGKNIRVELSTGKGRGGGGGGKDRRGFGGGDRGRSRPYGPPPGRYSRGDDDFYPPPPPFHDRYDFYARYYMEREREAFYSRGSMGGERDRYPPLPRDRYPDPRERLPPPRSYLDDRSRGLPPVDPYFREGGSRPPPEYYERKAQMGGRGVESVGAAGAAAGRGSAQGGYNGVGNGGDFYRRPGGASLGGAAGGAGSGDYFRQNGGTGQHVGYGGRGGAGMGGNKADSQSNFATDPIFF